MIIKATKLGYTVRIVFYLVLVVQAAENIQFLSLIEAENERVAVAKDPALLTGPGNIGEGTKDPVVHG